MDLESTIKLTIKCLIKSFKAREETPRIKITVIPSATKKLRILSEKEIGTYQRGIEGRED